MQRLFAGLVLSMMATSAEAASFEVKSPSVGSDGTLAPAQVLEGFGCHGGNSSPALAWEGPPAGTKSFAVTVYDPDAPTGSGWWHWTLFNLPPTVHDLAEGTGTAGGEALPPGAVQGRNDFGEAAYGGACPPPGDAPHHYVMTVWALKEATLPLNSAASGAMVGFTLNALVLAKASTVATYGRPK